MTKDIHRCKNCNKVSEGYAKFLALKNKPENKPKEQSSKGSMIETALNVGSGYFLAFALNLMILPYFVEGIAEYNVAIALGIGLIYTTVSFIRSLAFRRIFNNIMGKRKWL